MSQPHADNLPTTRTDARALRGGEPTRGPGHRAVQSLPGMAVCLIAALLGTGCQSSPRDEYMQNRAIEHRGTAGDGTTLSLAPRLGDTALAGANADVARADGVDDLLVR